MPVQVTGLGSLFGIHFTGGEIHNYRDLAASDRALRGRVFLGLLNEGILIAPNLVGAMSTSLGDEDVAAFLSAFRRVLERRP